MKQEYQKLFRCALLALGWGVLLALVELWEHHSGGNFSHYGLRPRSLEGLPGILRMHWIHGDPKDHLLSNLLALVPLSFSLFYFYPRMAWRVVAGLHAITGIWVWIAARDAWHIGASGIVYGIAFFLFFSGIFRKDKVAMAVALITVFFHGNMIWGTLPFFSPPGVSWEGHLFGGLAGILLAFYFRKRFLPKADAGPAFPEVEHDAWDYRKHFPPPEGFDHPD